MWKRARGSNWSLLLLRGADQNVRQFRVSKRSVVAAPAAAVLAVSGCIAGLQLHSDAQLSQAENEAAAQASSLSHAVKEKDSQVSLLQQEVDRLNRQTEQLKAKLNDLEELEAKLKQFTEAYGGAVHPDGPVQAPQDGTIEKERYSPDREAHAMVQMAAESNLDFRAISTLVDSMEQTMSASLRREQQRRAELAAIPSGWPTESRRLTSGFGYRTDPFTGRSMFHAGIDIGGQMNDPVFAAADGTVDETGKDGGRGNYIILVHRNGLKTAYFHLNRIEARAGDKVVRGEKIGLMGSTGRSTAAHLHFQIMQADEPINPFKYLRLVKED
jgi:murein DD-endopeptidase MepM/ murein hydrolase activator NlpD